MTRDELETLREIWFELDGLMLSPATTPERGQRILARVVRQLREMVLSHPTKAEEVKY